MAKYANRVQEATDTASTGTYSLNGATSGHQGFVAAGVTGTNIYYLVSE